MKVELDAFSGRPNPSWELSEAESRSILQRIETAAPVSSPASEPGLGYRGFVLRHGDVVYRVHAGIVEEQRAGRVRLIRDDSGIEAELAEDARRRGYDAIVKGVSRGK